MTPYDLHQFTFAPPLLGILQQVATEGLITAIGSAERCIDTQARVMAELEAEHPGWIAGTYRASPTLTLILDAIAALTAPRDAAALEVAIEGAFAQGTPAEISRHLPNADGLGEAVDLRPVGNGPLAARLRELVADGIASGYLAPHSCVLTCEAGHVVCHVQAWSVVADT